MENTFAISVVALWKRFKDIIPLGIIIDTQFIFKRYFSEIPYSPWSWSCDDIEVWYILTKLFPVSILVMQLNRLMAKTNFSS